MKRNPFNICPSCIHNDTCVLTTWKNEVWSCSEYDEETIEAIDPTNSILAVKIDQQSELVMV